ncbi:MAG: hypothetical protein AMXMBFR46_24820 [Acidimicrobiia bacterium]
MAATGHHRWGIMATGGIAARFAEVLRSVDGGEVVAVLRHPGERLGVVKTALRIPMTCTARVVGTDGTIEVPAFMHCPTSFTVRTSEGDDVVEAGWEGDGLRFQVDEVHRCLDAGLRESPRMPLSETLAVAEVMDEFRAQVGVRYPGEAT